MTSLLQLRLLCISLRAAMLVYDRDPTGNVASSACCKTCCLQDHWPLAMQVLGAANPDGPWLKAITERVTAVYCDRLSGYAWCSQVHLPVTSIFCNTDYVT